MSNASTDDRAPAGETTGDTPRGSTTGSSRYGQPAAAPPGRRVRGRKDSAAQIHYRVRGWPENRPGARERVEMEFAFAALPVRVTRPGWARDRGSVGCSAPGRSRLTAGTSRSVISWVKRLTNPERLRKSLFHGGDRSPSCGTSAPVGVPLAKGIRPLGRQCHRPSSDTASLGDEGVKGRLVRDQGRQLQEGCPAPRRGDWAALHRCADGS